MQTKAMLRAEMKLRKACMTSEDCRREAAAVWCHVESMPCFAKWQHILLYHSLPDELDTHEIIVRWAISGKQIYLPVVVGNELVVRRYCSAALHQGAYGIWEPGGDDVPASCVEAVIVPGIAFDANGNRLGRGKGYYDRLLPFCPAVRVGVSYVCQKVDELPSESHDCKMHYVVTASGVTLIKDSPEEIGFGHYPMTQE